MDLTGWDVKADPELPGEPLFSRQYDEERWIVVARMAEFPQGFPVIKHDTWAVLYPVTYEATTDKIVVGENVGSYESLVEAIEHGNEMILLRAD